MLNIIQYKLGLIFHNARYGIQSIFWKKDKSCVLLSSWFGKKFADNSRYLFQYLADNKAELGLKHVVWVTHNEEVLDTLRDMGYEAYLVNSPESIFYHKKCYYHLINNAPLGNSRLTGELLVDYSYGSKRINLWHGTGVIKNVGFESNEYKKKTQKHPSLYRIKNHFFKSSKILKKFVTEAGAWADNYFLSTSETEKEKIKAFFCLPDHRVIVSGYPRDAYLCRHTPQEQEVINIIKKYETIVLYLPTFRSQSDGFDMGKLADTFRPQIAGSNILFIQKAHSAAGISEKYSFNNNILNLESDFDINVITPLTTLVITDYSSILADAMYFNKPVVLYTPDYEQYMTEDRGLASDAELILSSSFRFSDAVEIVDFIINNRFDLRKMKKDNYQEIRERIWGCKDKHIEEIWKDILNQTV